MQKVGVELANQLFFKSPIFLPPNFENRNYSTLITQKLVLLARHGNSRVSWASKGVMMCVISAPSMRGPIFEVCLSVVLC